MLVVYNFIMETNLVKLDDVSFRYNEMRSRVGELRPVIVL
jgi:hypothetical protein